MPDGGQDVATLESGQPRGLNALRACITIGGVLVIAYTGGMLLALVAFARGEFHPIAIVPFLPGFIFGGAFLLASAGLTRRAKWAYYMVLALAVIGIIWPIIAVIFSIFIGGKPTKIEGVIVLVFMNPLFTPMAVILGLITLVLVSRKQVAKYFEESNAGEKENRSAL